MSLMGRASVSAPFPSPTKDCGPVTSVAPTENEIELMPAVTAARIRANKPKMVTMTLLRHYRPAGEFEIAGWNKPTIERKNVAGKMVVIEEGGFIPNEAAPSPTPGTGTPELGGFTTREAQAMVRLLEGVNIVGADVVEVSPPFDLGNLTALAGATMMFELLCVMAKGVAARR